MSKKRDTVEQCLRCKTTITDKNIGYRGRVVMCSPCANDFSIDELASGDHLDKWKGSDHGGRIVDEIWEFVEDNDG